MNEKVDFLKNRTTKSFKKFLYKSRTRGLKRLTSFVLVGAIVCSVVYSVRYFYINSTSSKAKISLTYPEITDSQYPDGSRFTYYDFISDDKLEKALKIMQKNGKYENFTVDDIKNNFRLYSYADRDMVSSLSEKRSEGADFSYVANEYKLTFVQPHDYKNKNIFKKFFTPNYSDEFLSVLMKVNSDAINKQHGGIGGFENLIALNDTSAYDYSEQVEVYRTKINVIVNYLTNLSNQYNDFISEEYDRTLQDLISEYKILSSNKLDGISSFIDASGLSADTEMAINKLKINIENYTLKCLKYDDAFYVNSYAQKAYDHTFTENLIVVTQNDDDELYQARPKTAFDTVVTDKHEAGENAVECQEKIKELGQDVTMFGTVEKDPDEYGRLCDKAEDLIDEFETEFTRISDEALSVVGEFYNSKNEDYLISKVEKKNPLTKDYFVKTVFVGCVGATIMFILYAVLEFLKENRKKKYFNDVRKKLKSQQGKDETKWEL